MNRVKLSIALAFFGILFFANTASAQSGVAITTLSEGSNEVFISTNGNDVTAAVYGEKADGSIDFSNKIKDIHVRTLGSAGTNNYFNISGFAEDRTFASYLIIASSDGFSSTTKTVSLD